MRVDVQRIMLWWMTRMRLAPSAVMVAMLIVTSACGGDDSVESKGTGTTSSTIEATSTSTTTGHGAGSGSTIAPPESTSTTIRPPASTRPSVGSGVFGTVTAGPTCPVAQAENPCDPRPVHTDVQARTAAGRVVATTHTDDAGVYDLQLAPATYTLVAATGSTRLARCPLVTVTVSRGRAVRANIACDTGIR